MNSTKVALYSLATVTAVFCVVSDLVLNPAFQKVSSEISALSNSRFAKSTGAEVAYYAITSRDRKIDTWYKSVSDGEGSHQYKGYFFAKRAVKALPGYAKEECALITATGSERLFSLPLASWVATIDVSGALQKFELCRHIKKESDRPSFDVGMNMRLIHGLRT